MKRFDTSLALSELRRRVRGKDPGGGEMSPLPATKQPEVLGDILRRIGFGRREQGHERNE